MNYTLDDIQEEMLKKFRFINTKMIGNGQANRDAGTATSPTGTVLAGTDANVRCYACGEIGYKTNEPNYPKKKEEGGGWKGRRRSRFRRPCNHCGVICHKEYQCWENSGNVVSRPQGWKSKMNKEAGNATVNVDSSPTKVIVVAIEKSTQESCHNDYEPEESTTEKIDEITVVSKKKNMSDKPTLALLKSKEIWIGNKGVICHSIPHDSSVVNYEAS